MWEDGFQFPISDMAADVGMVVSIGVVVLGLAGLLIVLVPTPPNPKG